MTIRPATSRGVLKGSNENQHNAGLSVINDESDLLPVAQDRDDSGVRGRFKDTNEESERIHGLDILRSRHQSCKKQEMSNISHIQGFRESLPVIKPHASSAEGKNHRGRTLVRMTWQGIKKTA